MERAKRPIQDKELAFIFDYIFQNAFGNPIIFDSAPSASDMKANSWGIYSTDLYVKFANGTTLKFSGTSVS